MKCSPPTRGSVARRPARIDACSPPTRGSVGASVAVRRFPVVLPAHAGVSRRRRRVRVNVRRAPRPRGGQSAACGALITAGLCSPPTRGSVVPAAGETGVVVVLPAHAGVSRLCSTNTPSWSGAPRPRGGQSVCLAGGGYGPQCSPPTRGSVVLPVPAVVSGAVLPAHAGVSRPRHAPRLQPPRAPRPRGGQSRTGYRRRLGPGCSPPTRGSVVCDGPRRGDRDVLPAHAGVSRRRRPRRCRHASAPRPRGGQSVAYDQMWFTPDGGVLPAHAGVSRMYSSAISPRSSAPRPRGGQSATARATARRRACSPPTRGSVALTGSACPARTVLPAHAGVSRRMLTRRPKTVRAPRPRGGQSIVDTTPDGDTLCSPPTRGSVAVPAAPAWGVAVLPAHAGVSRSATG